MDANQENTCKRNDKMLVMHHHGKPAGGALKEELNEETKDG